MVMHRDNLLSNSALVNKVGKSRAVSAVSHTPETPCSMGQGTECHLSLLLWARRDLHVTRPQFFPDSLILGKVLSCCLSQFPSLENGSNNTNLPPQGREELFAGCRVPGDQEEEGDTYVQISRLLLQLLTPDWSLSQ